MTVRSLLDCHTYYALLVLALAAVAGLTGAEIGSQPAARTDGPRTVMDLMEVMLNRDLLEMLKNGGFDFRQPSLLFLPPKFYSTVPLDHGHMTPEQILSGSLLEPSSSSSASSLPAAVGGKAEHQKAAAIGVRGDQPQSAAVAAAARLNLISYSDGKVTFAGQPKPSGSDRQPAPWTPATANKGSATLGENVGTNVESLQAAGGRGGSGGGGTGGQATNDRPLTTSITDQTVSQNVARTLPASGGRRVSAGGAATSATERLRSVLPGEPDVDYPILGSIPSTGFSCEGRAHGYYADTETRCQVFRVCANTDATGRGFGFLCPNGTLFNQRFLVCDWYTNVQCEASKDFYHLNADIGRMSGRPMVSDDRDDMMDSVMSMMTYPMRSLMRMMQATPDLERPKVVSAEVPNVAKPPRYPMPAVGLEAPHRPHTGTGPRLSGLAVGEQQLRTPVSNALPPAEYVPQLDQVFVSSLGSLSTDADSGFDPVRSNLLTGKDSTKGTPQAVRPHTNQLQTQNELAGSKFQVVQADLVKYWNDQSVRTAAGPPSSLKLRPVSEAFKPVVSTHHRIGQSASPAVNPNRPILPPTGVLPPSTLHRNAGLHSGGKLFNDFTHQPTYRFTPARKVLPIQKVTVQQDNRYRQSSGTSSALVFGQNVFLTPGRPKAAAAKAYLQQASSERRQILRRIDTVPKHRKTSLQVVPSLAYYLNDVQEKQAYDEAVLHGLLDERRHDAYLRWAGKSVASSYDVPPGSVGRP
ncbi:uncharacterized protein LOC128267022 [Anopheles cruzii]|uniref:uncharacterized protein LOC128267022 n=1 Tax=Anopheles cruzii TaxID=68878 RepID=UPI0022EC79B5|nr:uncharacterized protein LOC128267022 [Anopheles cruzii]